MKLFVTGIGGQLGHDVVNEAVVRGFEVIGSDISPSYSGIADGSAVTSVTYYPLDITNETAVTSTLEVIHPDAVIHCAAWTDVDAAEEPDNFDRVEKINHIGTRYVAAAAERVNAKMMYISTDYVFNGEGAVPWMPDDKNYAPLNYYGKTKLEGEKAVSEILSRFFIVRIAWAFGLNGKNFIKTMIQLGKKHDEVRVVNDQIGTPTYTLDLARLLIDMIESENYGYYHVTNSECKPEEYISWFEFCIEIYRQCGMKTKVIPVSAKEYGRNCAVRPCNSRLDKTRLVKAGFTPLPDWKDALNRYLKNTEVQRIVK